MMPKYKVEMIVEVIDGHPRKWIAETVEMALEDGEDILARHVCSRYAYQLPEVLH